jgi:hypothetical protein
MSKDRSRKDQKPNKVYKFLNEYTWEFGRRFPDTGSTPESWQPRELELPSMGRGWISYLTLNVGTRFANIGLRYGTPCLQWDTTSILYKLRESSRKHNPHFVRWWLDTFLRKESDALWNHVFNMVMKYKHNENIARTQADLAASEFEKPYLGVE